MDKERRNPLNLLNKKNYYNTINLQIENLRDLVELQVERCFNLSKLSSLMSEKQFKNLKRVVITGCGDSYSAAGSMLHAFRLHSNVYDTVVPDPMEFCRFYTEEELLKGRLKNEVLVIAISASGGSERIVEMMRKGRKHGVQTMLITNNPESQGALAADRVFHVETPDGCNSPGLRSYFASMIALNAFSAYVGLIQGHITQARFDEIQQQIVQYTKTFLEDLERIDNQMFSIALDWKDFSKFEIIGDENEGFSAQFVEEKMIECAGVHCTHADSEDWCHINYFLREPDTIGTIALINSQAPDFDRMQYTLQSAVDIGRPVLVVTDASADDSIPEETSICRITPAEPWLMPLMDFIPGSLLGAYLAAINDKLFFRGRYDYRSQQWIL